MSLESFLRVSRETMSSAAAGLGADRRGQSKREILQTLVTEEEQVRAWCTSRARDSDSSVNTAKNCLGRARRGVMVSEDTYDRNIQAMRIHKVLHS